MLEKHGLSHDDLVRTLRVLAITHAVLNHDDAARDAFVQLLTVSPDEAIDANLGPKVTGPFYEARGYWRAQPARPGIDATASLPVKPPSRVTVTMRDPTHVVVQVNVGYRWGHDGDFTASTVAVKGGEVTSVSLPPAPAGQVALDFYAQAIDEHEDVIFENGSPTSPKSADIEVTTIAMPAPAPAEAKHDGGSFFSSAPFWIGVGVVIVGGAGRDVPRGPSKRSGPGDQRDPHAATVLRLRHTLPVAKRFNASALQHLLAQCVLRSVQVVAGTGAVSEISTRSIGTRS